jgi:hypothetical protein
MYIKTPAARLPKAIWLLRALAVLLLSWTAAAQSDEDIAPLFADDDLLNVKIIAPLTSIMFDRKDDKDVPGTFQYVATDGRSVDFDIGLRTRGNFRRRRNVCKFAPLRINFKVSQTRETLFDQQDKVKLVTHCQGVIEYQNNVAREYLAYRVFNILTDESFRVRVLRITYVDTDKKNRETVSYGFLIEPKDQLAQRIRATQVELKQVFVPDLQPAFTNRTSLFHYFLGNIDFSQIYAETGDNCCHNQVLFSNADGFYFSIPYDFDMSDFVGAEHSSPSSQFAASKPRRRLYRGWCANNAQLPASVKSFDEKRGEIDELINTTELLSKAKRKSLLRFIDKFYKSVESAKDIEKNIVKNCRN